MRFENKIVLITGGSRGIGKAIAIKLAEEGAHIAIVGKTVEAHPKLEGTIYSAAEEIDRAGPGKVLALPGDIRMEESIAQVVQQTSQQFGGIDILVNNASAISLTGTADTSTKRWDLMHDINARGTFFMSQACIPHLRSAANPHILNLSPPLNMNPRWFAPHLAYTLSKYNMSMIAMGLAAELAPLGIAVNALWPRTTIATAAVQNLLGGDMLMKKSRKPEIVADAAAEVLARPSKENSGRFFIDEEVLREAGVTDFSGYDFQPGATLMPDLFLD